MSEGSGANAEAHYTREFLDRISDQWTYPVVATLDRGRRRFNDLTRMVTGISPKMLTQTLRTLERDGLIKRIRYPCMPPHVEYELTNLGRSLAHVLKDIERWAFSNIPDVIAAREAYESQRPPHH